MENTKYGKRREGRWTPIRAKAQDTRANPNSWETHLVRKRWDIGLLRALSPRIMMMMMMMIPSPPSSSSFPINLYFSPLLQVITRSFLFIFLFNSLHPLSGFLSFLHLLFFLHFFLQLPLLDRKS